MTFEKQNFVIVGAGSAEGIGASFVRELLSIGVEVSEIFHRNYTQFKIKN